jgi:hypothetical protein
MTQIETLKKYYFQYLGFYNPQLDHFDLDYEDLKAKKYFESFQIPQKNWSKYDQLRDLVFNINKKFPEMLFKSADYKFLPLVGGNGVDNQTFNIVKKLTSFFNDEFFIIEHYPLKLYGEDFGLRMKFPRNISWEGYCGGSYLSIALEKAPLDDSFLIYGNSGKWGYLIANDYWVNTKELGIPLNIIGVEEESIDLVTSELPHSFNEDMSEIIKSLPDEYVKRLIHN